MSLFCCACFCTLLFSLYYSVSCPVICCHLLTNKGCIFLLNFYSNRNIQGADKNGQHLKCDSLVTVASKFVHLFRRQLSIIVLFSEFILRRPIWNWHNDKLKFEFCNSPLLCYIVVMKVNDFQFSSLWKLPRGFSLPKRKCFTRSISVGVVRYQIHESKPSLFRYLRRAPPGDGVHFSCIFSKVFKF